MQDATTFWNRIAEKYASKPIEDIDAYHHTLERTKVYLSRADKVLEVGCGTGSTALLLADSVGEIAASDLSPKMIAIANEKAAAEQVPNARFLAADFLADVIEGGPYDAVLAFNLLHLLPDPAAAARRVHALLRPGGVFISKTHCEPDAGAPLKYRLMRLILPVMQLLGKAPFVNFIRVGELESAIAAQGFDILEAESHCLSPPSRFIVARKV